MATGRQQVLSAGGCGRRPPATRHPHNYARRSLLLTNVHPAGRLAARESLGRARDTLPCTCGFCYTISLPAMPSPMALSRVAEEERCGRILRNMQQL